MAEDILVEEAPGEAHTGVVAVIVDPVPIIMVVEAVVVTTEGTIPEIGTVAEITPIPVLPGTIRIGTPGKTTGRVRHTRGTITRTREIVAPRTGNAQGRIILREVVMAAQETITVAIAAAQVAVEAHPIGTTIPVAAHPTTNVAMIIIRLDLALEAEREDLEQETPAGIGLITVAAVVAAVTKQEKRWDHHGPSIRDFVIPTSAVGMGSGDHWGHDHRFRLLFVADQCAVVLIVISGTTDAVE